MPPKNKVLSLAQLSVNSLTKLFIKVLDPRFLLSPTICSQPEDLNSDLGLLKESPEDLRTHSKRNESCENKNTPQSILEQEEYGRGIGTGIENVENSPSRQASLLQRVQDLVMSLARYGTSHAHCSLQELLFSSMLTALNRLYIKHRCQEMRNIIRKIVPLFINTTLRVLDFGSFKMFTESSMFMAIYEHLPHAEGLEKLVFGRSCYWRSKSILNLNKAVERMTNLQVLHMHYICQPDMLCGLPKSCPQLQELSLKGSRDITNTEVPFIIQFVNLTTLDITGTSITGMGCRSLVLGLPILTWLTHCPFNCNSDTLIFESRTQLFNYIKTQLHKQPVLSADIAPSTNEIPDSTSSSRIVPEETVQPKTDETNLELMTENSLENDAIFTLKLRNFWLFNTTTEELLLTNLCPQLEHLRLDFVMQDLTEAPNVEAIVHLPHLSSLALYAYDRCPNQLVLNVLASTRNLSHLHLHLGDEWFFVAPIVNEVCRSCPSLTSLTMEGDYKGEHSLEESDSRLDFALPPEGLARLKEARICGCVTHARLLHLLTQAPNLRTLYLDGDLELIHDNTIIHAIKHDLLLQLQEIWFNVSAGVTLSSVRRLLQSDNDLRRVGRLCLMSSASREGYQDLLLLVRSRNLSTELVWVTDQRDLQLDTIVRS